MFKEDLPLADVAIEGRFYTDNITYYFGFSIMLSNFTNASSVYIAIDPDANFGDISVSVKSIAFLPSTVILI